VAVFRVGGAVVVGDTTHIAYDTRLLIDDFCLAGTEARAEADSSAALRNDNKKATAKREKKATAKRDKKGNCKTRQKSNCKDEAIEVAAF
jgi:hypothetical protein